MYVCIQCIYIYIYIILYISTGYTPLFKWTVARNQSPFLCPFVQESALAEDTLTVQELLDAKARPKSGKEDWNRTSDIY